MTSSLVLDRIYAFNPAGPLFLPNKLFPDSQDNPMARLDKTDARLVDVIHTDGDCLGSFKMIGHVDIYPVTYKGYGANQPGTQFFGESHSRSKAIYKATISDQCKTSHSCVVLMDSECEVDMFKKNVQSEGYTQFNLNASGAFLIDTTETMNCMIGNHVEFGQDNTWNKSYGDMDL